MEEAVAEEEVAAGEGELEHEQQLFTPPDDELVDFYLKKKIMGQQLPLPIPTIDFFAYRPQDLPFSLCRDELARCFFTERKKGRILLPNGRGYYQVSGHATICRTNSSDAGNVRQHQLVGFSRTLDFYSGVSPNGVISIWKVQEFRINPSIVENLRNDQIGWKRVLNLALCKVFKKVPPPPPRIRARAPDYIRDNKFNPDENQILDHFLKGKIMGQKLPHNPIPTFDVFSASPRDLPFSISRGHWGGIPFAMPGEWYFFSNTRRDDAFDTDAGHYRLSSSENVYNKSGNILGSIRTLDYYNGKLSSTVQAITEWCVKEFKINPGIVRVRQNDHATRKKVSNLVICKVINKSERVPWYREEDDEHKVEGPEEPEEMAEYIADPDEIEEDIADAPQEDEEDNAESEIEDAPAPKRARGQ